MTIYHTAGGTTAALLGTDFWTGVKAGAITGAITGAVFGGIDGGIRADKAGQGIWWGNKIGYNRSKWSLAWWDKPDIAWSSIERVAGKTLKSCVYAGMESISASYGLAEHNQEFWLEQTKNILNKPADFAGGVAGKELTQVVESVDGYCIEQIKTNFPNAPKEAFGTIQSGKQVGIGVNGEEHFMPVKQIKIWPDGKFQIKVMDPNGGIMRIFNTYDYQGYNFWSIYRY